MAMLIIMKEKWYERDMENILARSTSKAREAREEKKTTGRIPRMLIMGKSPATWHQDKNSFSFIITLVRQT
jgi:hypothetical protein